MNHSETKKPCCKCGIHVVAVLGTFLIVGWLVWLMQKYTTPAPIGQERAEERRKAFVEMRAAETQGLNNYGWQDQGKGIVRLPVQRAKELTLQEWQDPAAGRKELIARLDKATAAPPKAPEKPSEFE